MALPKVETIELKNVTKVFFQGTWLNIKEGSLEEKGEGYAFQDTAGNKYFVNQYGVGFTNHPVPTT
jgi:hypothetical protein